MKIKRSRIEEENLYGKGISLEGEITEPFNPKDVDIITQSMVVANVIERLKDGRIVLDPDFQRRPDLWDEKRQSRLIESLIVRIPLPSFYFDYDMDMDSYTVVDGLQRLWAIRKFAAIDKEDPDRLKLTGLEYLTEYNGKTYEELPLLLQRRIREQELVAYVIRPGTPDSVRNSIFKRINTGGMQLTQAEIRNAVYRGQAADLLKELAHSEQFSAATNHKVRSERMEDCELVNRFLAFYLLDIDKYTGNLEKFLNDAMLYLKNAELSELNECREVFQKAMRTAISVFGENAFRKINRNEKYGNKINKPLFECVSVCFARLTELECSSIIKKKEDFLDKYNALLRDEEFFNVITNGTARRTSIATRHRELSRIIKETLG